MADQSFRILKLEQDVMHIKKQLIHKDEEKHRTWCDLQEQLLRELGETHEKVSQVELVVNDDHDRLIRVEEQGINSQKRSEENAARIDRLAADVEILKLEYGSKLDQMASDMTAIRETLNQLSNQLS